MSIIYGNYKIYKKSYCIYHRNCNMIASRVIFLFAVLCCTASVCNSICGKILDKGVLPEHIEQIVNQHNEIRNDLMEGKINNQPQAAHLAPLVYDEALAEEAQVLADNCKLQLQNAEDKRYTRVGQNIYIVNTIISKKHPDWKAAIDAWFNGNLYYVYNGDLSSIAATYTQIIWERTTRLGCGYLYADDELNKDGHFVKIYICLYGPGGNISNRPPYRLLNDTITTKN